MASAAIRPGFDPAPPPPGSHRLQAVGFAVALAAHAGLILLLSRRSEEPPKPPETVEVSFLEETGPVTSAPEPADTPPAAAEGQEQSPTDTPSAADAPAPEEATPVAEPTPAPEPVRTPVETADRRRPDITRNPVPVQPRAVPQPTPRPQLRPVTPRLADNRPQPRPTQPRPSPTSRQPAPRQPASTQVARNAFDANRLSRLLGPGVPQGSGIAPRGNTRPAASGGAPLSGAQQQQLARQISGLIQPCAGRAVPPNGFARGISVDLRVTVTQDGVPTGHQLVRSGGTDDDNRSYVPAVVDTAMRAVRACAARIATLPADQYAGGWRTFTYRFRFP